MPKATLLFAILLLLLLLPGGGALADVVVVAGAATVADGDTLDVGGFRVDLWGIDAPEVGQKCWRNRGGDWACGVGARRALIDLIAGNEVTCVEKARRRSGRIVGVCTVIGTGIELNEALVVQGLAISDQRDTRAYAGAEGYAKGARRGMWGGRFVPPEHWRRMYRYRMKFGY